MKADDQRRGGARGGKAGSQGQGRLCVKVPEQHSYARASHGLELRDQAPVEAQVEVQVGAVGADLQVIAVGRPQCIKRACSLEI